MGSIFFRACLCLISLFVSSCALPVTQSPQASYSSLKSEIRHETGDILEKYVAARQRLMMVGMPLLIQNAQLCPRRTLSAGFAVHSDFDLPAPLQDVAAERLNLGRQAVVLSVFQGTTAWHEGLRPGDIVLSMNGKNIRNAGELRARIKKIKQETTVEFGFIRAGKSFTLKLPFTPICNYPFTYLPADPELSAYTNGKRIFITQRMMDFTTDDELAAIIGHELAHAIMHHIDKDAINTLGIEIAGALIDSFFDIGLRDALLTAYTEAFSPAFEQEADYVGLYLLARAGGNIEAASPFWRKMAAERGMDSVVVPANILQTHPAAPARFAALRAAEAEIKAKTKAGKPLMPEMASHWNFGQRYSWWSDTTDDDDEPTDDDLND